MSIPETPRTWTLWRTTDMRWTSGDNDDIGGPIEVVEKAPVVLCAVPACGEGNEYRRRGGGEAATIWQVAEMVNSTDLADVRLTLNGLVHLGYVLVVESASRKRSVWWRTRKGDEAVVGSSRELSA